MTERYIRTIRLVLETPDAKSATRLAETLAKRVQALDYAVVEAVAAPAPSRTLTDHE